MVVTDPSGPASLPIFFRDHSPVQAIDSQHERLPWGLVSTANGTAFSTSQEAAYPRGLCDSSCSHCRRPVVPVRRLASRHRL